jgi:hypothetical protein
MKMAGFCSQKLFKMYTMMKSMRFVMGILILAFIAGVNFGCSDSASKGTVKFYLTDAPAAYDAVNIEITGMTVKSNVKNSDESIVLERAGVYDLLHFSGGVDTLLGSIELTAGTVSQIRLILGENNSVVMNGETIEMKVPSGSESGLKLNLNEKIEEGLTYKFWIDFDVSRSLVAQGNGKYSLKPVLRLFSEATSGAIKGTVTPMEAKPFVQVISGTDTLGTIATDAGVFVLKGVPEGTYSLIITPQNGMKSVTMENIGVTVGKSTDVGQITLK